MAKGHTVRVHCLGATLASVLTLAVAGAAAATTTPTTGPVGAPAAGGSATSRAPATVAGLQRLADTQIKHRVATLDAAVDRVRSGRGSGAAATSLEHYLGQDVGPLQQLDSRIQKDRTLPQVQRDYGTIFSDFRVYRLVLPAAHLAESASHVTGSELPTLQMVAARVQHNAGAVAPSSVSALELDLQNEITAATDATNGLAATALADTPAEWNADNNLLAGLQASLSRAVAAVTQGRSDAQQLHQLLVGSATPHVGARQGPKQHTRNSTSTT